MTNLDYFNEMTKDLEPDKRDLVAHCVLGAASIILTPEDFQRAVNSGLSYIGIQNESRRTN